MGEYPLRPFGAPLPRGEASGRCDKCTTAKTSTPLALPLGELSAQPTEREKPLPKGSGREVQTMTLPKDNSKLDAARQLRREMTPHERKLWYLFLRKYPVKIYKQRIIGKFIVDFYCASAKLVIEVDGSQHYDAQGMAYDAERTAFLESHGLTVLRYSNRDIDREFDRVCAHIDHIIRQRLEQA